MIAKKWGQFANKLTRAIRRHGYQAALEAEIERPQSTDQDWCRMVVALAAGREATFETDPRDPPPFTCPQCRDTGFLLTERPSGYKYRGLFSTACPCLRDKAAAHETTHPRRTRPPSW